jgi:type II secretory pathway predicted ATPase ExeA
LKGHIDHPDPNVSLKGLDQSWKLDGAYTEKHVHVHATYEDMTKNLAEIQKKRRQLEVELGIVDAEYTESEGEIIEDD